MKLTRKAFEERSDVTNVLLSTLNKLAKLRRCVSRVHFGKIHFGKIRFVNQRLKAVGHSFQIIPSQMEVAPLHCTVDITQKRGLFKNTKEIKKM